MGKLLALSLACTLAAAVLFQPALMGKPARSPMSVSDNESLSREEHLIRADPHFPLFIYWPEEDPKRPGNFGSGGSMMPCSRNIDLQAGRLDIFSILRVCHKSAVNPEVACPRLGAVPIPHRQLTISKTRL
jgi:hypothetical protein